MPLFCGGFTLFLLSLPNGLFYQTEKNCSYINCLYRNLTKPPPHRKLEIRACIEIFVKLKLVYLEL